MQKQLLLTRTGVHLGKKCKTVLQGVPPHMEEARTMLYKYNVPQPYVRERLLAYAKELSNIVYLPALLDIHHLYVAEAWKNTKDPVRCDILEQITRIILDTVSKTPVLVAAEINGLPFLQKLLEYQFVDVFTNDEVSFYDWYIACRQSSIGSVADIVKKYQFPTLVGEAMAYKYLHHA